MIIDNKEDKEINRSKKWLWFIEIFIILLISTTITYMIFYGIASST